MSTFPDEYSSANHTPSPRQRLKMHPVKRAMLICLTALLFTGILNNWPLILSNALAATVPVGHGKTTIAQALQQTTTDTHASSSTFARPTSVPAVPASTQKTTTTSTTPLASTEPVKMHAASYHLDSSFLVGTSVAPATKALQKIPAAKSALSITPATIPGGSAPLIFKGSDGRLEVQVPRGALDLTHATIDGGTAPVGALSLQISQQQGHSIAARVSLGSYTIQIVDSQGHVVQGITLRQPASIRYHYQRDELQKFGLDPNHMILSQPASIVAAQAAKQSTAGLVTTMANNTATLTLTAQVMVLAAANVNGESALQTPATPRLASVQGNSGQLSYSYPLTVAPGANGFAPSLALSYSSESTNERTSRRAPAGAVGDGWDLSLGSITMETYPSTSTSGAGTWYFLSGIGISGGVSDRLVQSATGTGSQIFYATEHISALRILFDGSCFQIWDRSGYYYELGCTSDSKQSYSTTGTSITYRWDLDKVLAPYDSTSKVKTMLVSYLQDQTTVSGVTVTRDAVIKQIKYGYATTTNPIPTLAVLDGTVDFHYHAPTVPSGQGSFVTAYGNNYNCTGTPPATTTLRCDDPGTFNSVASPTVMSTFSLDSVTSYVGDDSTSSHEAYSYALTYQDTPYTTDYYEPYSMVNESASGNHLLTQVTPTIYQNGTAHVRKATTFGYTAPRQDLYRDPSHLTANATQAYGGQTFWDYLKSYDDLNTGVGENITYSTAFANTHGTPYVVDTSGTVTDDRHDPLFCSTHTTCTGNYLHPEDYAWSTQVVTQIQNRGSDSPTWNNVSPATTTYSYWLSPVEKNAGLVSCNPITASGTPSTPLQTDCVGDNWVPGYNGTTNQMDGDWMDYYHAEFRGFQGVFITNPLGNLTTDYYFATDGWNTPQSNGGNYNRGELYEEDHYWGNQATTGAQINQTLNSYAGVTGPFNTIGACDGRLNPTYNPCILEALRTKTIDFEGSGDAVNSPWVQQDLTYDDINASSGYIYSNTYHNLLKTVTTSSNAPTVTEKWSYTVNNQTTGGVTYYDVNKVTHHEIDDASGHVWQCQDTAYDEGSATGVPSPSAGWGTTTTQYTDCSNQATTAIKGYNGYDQYGNVVATVDAFGIAHSSAYASSGCTLSTAPVIAPTAWTAGRYTTCSTYDSYGAQTLTQKNALSQTTTATHDYTQGGLPTSTINANNQTTSLTYSYPDSNTVTVQQHSPGETGSYTTQSSEKSTCTSSSTTPCYEIDTNSSLYPNAITQTFYNSLGQAVETRAPLDANNDLMTYTLTDERGQKSFKSVPFRFPHSVTGWIDPANASIDNGGQNWPSFTMVRYNGLGQVTSTTDPLYNNGGETGISCDGQSGTWSTCSEYGYTTPHGSTTTYAQLESINTNNHATYTLTDELGNTRYNESFSTRGALNSALADSNLTTLTETQYNVLNKPTAVIVTDLAPQTGQTITSVTTTATYNDLGQVTSSTDPDRGTHTYTYDTDGRVIKDVSGTRTIGASYDLLGRAICEQDAAPTTDGSGTCSSGSHPLVQNTYDTTALGTAGSTDFSVGALTQSLATTYYPDGTATTVTEKVQHDLRGRGIASTIQVSLPSSWNVTTMLPTYQKTQAYNDANQPMTTQTTVGGQAGYTFSQAYDSTTGTSIGLSNTNVGTAMLASQSFDEHGQLSDLNFLSTSTTALANAHFTYDDNSRPVSTNATWQSGSGSTGTILSNARTYDPVGNVISLNTTQAAVPGQSNSGGSETQNFCYDEQNRLVWSGNTGTTPAAGNGTCGTATSANSLNGASYSTNQTYTHLGQLWQGPLQGAGSTLQYLYCDNTHPHQLTGIYPTGTTCTTASTTAASYSTSYDNWGNQTSRSTGGTTSTLSYDQLDHLVQDVVGSTGQEWYAYDASGERIVQRSTLANATALTIYAFGLEEHTYSATGASGNSTYYYYLGGRIIGELTGTGTQYFLTDALGSVLSSFSAIAGSAAVQGNTVYGPYGNQRYSSGSVGTNKGFTGQYHDTTGLDYYHARYYDAVAGIFIAADTEQGNGQGMNPYAYVGGNPETMSDPTGHRQCEDSCGYGEKCYPDKYGSCGNSYGGGGGNSGGGGGGGGNSGSGSGGGGNSGSGSGGGGGGSTPTPTPTPQPTPTPTPQGGGGSQSGSGSPTKNKCAFMCGPVNNGTLGKGIAEFIGGAVGLGFLIATFNAALAATGGLLILAANYIKSAIAQAARLIIVGIQDIFDSAAEHNPWVDVVLDGLKIVADVLTLAFGISDTAKLISNIRNGSGLIGKAKFLIGESGDFFKGQGTQIKSHVGLITGVTNSFVVAAAFVIGGEVVPDGIQFAGDLQSALNY